MEGTGPTSCPRLQGVTTHAARRCSRARWVAFWPLPNATAAASAAALSSVTRVSAGPQPRAPTLRPAPPSLRFPAPALWAGSATRMGPGPGVGAPIYRHPLEGPRPPALGVPRGVFPHTLVPLFSCLRGLSEAGMGSGWGRGRDRAARALAGPQLPCADPPSPPGAVCKFCQPRESELYQKEVRGEAGGLWGWQGEDGLGGAGPPFCPLSPGVPPERPGGALLAPLDPVPALSGQPARGRHLHQVRGARSPDPKALGGHAAPHG